MVHFSGKARKMNRLSSFCASEASAKVPFNAYFEFMYGFKVEIINNCSFHSQKRRKCCFSGFARKTNHLLFFCERSEQ
ncbi:MAG: hypothetical protein U5L45_17735 [Saprospiraceae bacterium]|nr:hypothetical protein [Saprospiraceae bacterium]